MTGATVSHPTTRWTIGRWALGATAVLFGVAMLLEGGHALSGGAAARAEAGNFVSSGGAFEPRTVIAMTLRSGFWVAQALLLPHVLDWRMP